MNVAIAMQGLASFVWLLVIGLIVLAVVRASRGQPVRATSTTILVLAVLAVLLTSVSAGLVFIEPEQRGVVISAVAPLGYREQPLQPGLRWIVPFLERVERYTISRQTYTMSVISTEGLTPGDDSVAARTADGQEIFVDASVIFQTDAQKVVQLHIEWQQRYTDELIRPLARGIIRDAVSQYGVEEVYSLKRAEMTDQIQQEMSRKLQENGLLLVDFVLRNITFSDEYAASVEQKQIAEQQAQQARFVVEQRRQEAEQARQVAQGRADARLIEAEAEQKALDFIAAALANNPDLLTYNYINKLAPGIQVMLVPNDSPFLLPLPQVGPPAPETAGTTAASPTPTAIPLPTPTPTPNP